MTPFRYRPLDLPECLNRHSASSIVVQTIEVVLDLLSEKAAPAILPLFQTCLLSVFMFCPWSATEQFWCLAPRIRRPSHGHGRYFSSERVIIFYHRLIIFIENVITSRLGHDPGPDVWPLGHSFRPGRGSTLQRLTKTSCRGCHLLQSSAAYNGKKS